MDDDMSALKPDVAVVQTTASTPTVEKYVPPRMAISDETWNVAIGRWITDHLRSTPTSHDTEGWNHLTTVIPRLREILEEEMKKL